MMKFLRRLFSKKSKGTKDGWEGHPVDILKELGVSLDKEIEKKMRELCDEEVPAPVVRVETPLKDGDVIIDAFRTRFKIKQESGFIYGSTNEWEKACKEFLKGWSCTSEIFGYSGKQEECPECLKAFCDHLRKLGEREVKKK